MTVNNSVLTPLLVYFSSLTHEESRQMKQTQQRHKSPTNFFINFKFRPSQSRQFAQPFFFYLGRLLYHKLGVPLVTLDFRENSVAIRGIRGIRGIKTPVLVNLNKIYCDLPVCSVALSLFYLLQNYNLKKWLHPTLTAVIEFFFVLSKNLKCFNSTKKIIYRIVLHFHELFN